LSVGKRGTVYWERNETIALTLLDEGWVENDKNGRIVRHFGVVRWYHIGRGQRWPETCIRGDCPICMKGHDPKKRFLATFSVGGKTAKVSVTPYMDRVLGRLVEECVRSGQDPRGRTVLVTYGPGPGMWAASWVGDQA